MPGAAWSAYTLVRGPIADRYPYPFLDPALESVASIVVTCIGILVVFVVARPRAAWSGAAASATGERAVAIVR